MEYITNIPKWNIEKGDYLQETKTPDKIPGYISCGIFFDKELKLFSIGGTKKDNYSSNWDIYADKDGNLYSIARKGSGCSNTYFGTPAHIKNLIRQGHFNNEFTAYGHNMMATW